MRPPLWLVLVIFVLVTLLQFPTNIIMEKSSAAIGIFVDEVFFILILPLLILRLAGYKPSKFLRFGRSSNITLMVCVCLIFGAGVLLSYIQTVMTSLVPIPEKLLRMQSQVMWVSSWGDFYLKLVLIAIVAPICEEILFRGLIQDALSDRVGKTKAIFITAIFFSLMHSMSFQPILFFLLGLVFAWIYAVTGSLRTAIVCHAINNTWAMAMDVQNMGFPLQMPVGAPDVMMVIFALLVVACSLAWFGLRGWKLKEAP
jgi:uncharacterized protein